MSRTTLALLEEIRQDPEALALLRDLVDSDGGTGGERRLLTPEEAGDRLRMHPKTLTKAAHDGRMPGARKIAGRWRFDPANLELLPVERPALGPIGAGRPSRRAAAIDPVARAMRETAARRAA